MAVSKIIGLAFLSTLVFSCTTKTEVKLTDSDALGIEGTWKLISGTLIEKGDTTVTNYTKDKSFIKIINGTHFAFITHDLNKGKDSTTASFSSGAGGYSLKGNTYTEHLEYCSDREWEGHDFSFTITINSDTLVQRGVEKIEAAGVDRLNIEKYVRLK